MEPQVQLMQAGPGAPGHTLSTDDPSYNQNNEDLGIWYLEIWSQRLKKMRREFISPSA